MYLGGWQECKEAGAFQSLQKDGAEGAESQRLGFRAENLGIAGSLCCVLAQMLTRLRDVRGVLRLQTAEHTVLSGVGGELLIVTKQKERKRRAQWL